MATWYIVRHADRDWGAYYNPKLHIQDDPISQKGRQQAQNLIPYFADKGLSRIYVSAYQRTLQTATPLAEHLNLTPVVDERVNEMNNGLFSSVPEEELPQRFPKEWQAFRERRSDFRFPEGETGEEVKKRILDFLDEKRKQHDGESIIAVAHDGVIRTLMCGILGLPAYQRWNFQIDFAGITEIDYQPKYETWKLIRFNQICS